MVLEMEHPRVNLMVSEMENLRVKLMVLQMEKWSALAMEH